MRRGLPIIWPNKLAVVSAHPDDAEMGCYGAIARLACPCSVLVMTDGEAGYALGTSRPEGLAAIRRDEARSALEALGCDVEFAGLADGYISVDPSTIGAIEDFLRRHQPDVVITHALHNPVDHQDHSAVATATSNVAWRLPFLRGVWHFEPLRFQPGSWSPNLFVEISPFLSAKVEAVGRHKSQAGRDYLTQEWVAHRARQNALMARAGGLQAGEHYEAFAITKQVLA